VTRETRFVGNQACEGTTGGRVPVLRDQPAGRLHLVPPLGSRRPRRTAGPVGRPAQRTQWKASPLSREAQAHGSTRDLIRWVAESVFTDESLREYERLRLLRDCRAESTYLRHQVPGGAGSAGLDGTGIYRPGRAPAAQGCRRRRIRSRRCRDGPGLRRHPRTRDIDATFVPHARGDRGGPSRRGRPRTALLVAKRDSRMSGWPPRSGPPSPPPWPRKASPSRPRPPPGRSSPSSLRHWTASAPSAGFGTLWPGVGGCRRRGRGCLGEPGVQPCPDLVRSVGAAAALGACDHDSGGGDACERCQAEYLPPAHLPRLRLCLARASAWMRLPA
jgi:hypothetical protein